MALEAPTKLNQLDVLVLGHFFLYNLSFAFALRLTPRPHPGKLWISHDQQPTDPTMKPTACAPSMIVLVARIVAKLNAR